MKTLRIKIQQDEYHNKTQAVLDDYNMLLSFAENARDSSKAIYEKCSYLIKIGKDLSNEQALISQILNSIPSSHMRNNLGGDSPYFLLFYLYGKILMESNEAEAGVNSLMISVDHGFSHQSALLKKEVGLFLDSTIMKHPKNYDLKVIRFIWKLKTSRYGRDEVSKNRLYNEIKILDKLKLKEEAFFYYKAKFLLVEKDYDKALKAINRSIKLNFNNPLAHQLKYEINYRKGQAITPFKNDSDWIRFDSLRQEWVFPKLEI